MIVGHDNGRAVAAHRLPEDLAHAHRAGAHRALVHLVDAQHVEGADKLLQLTLDLGGDKFVSDFCLESEVNPAMGLRAIA